MYFPSSQVELNLISNGELVYKTNKKPYHGTYFSTSTGKYYVGSPNETVLIELIPLSVVAAKSDPLAESDPSFVQNNTVGSEFSSPDARFESFNSEIYSLLTKAPITPPVIESPSFYSYRPSPDEISIGYSMRFFAKKVDEIIYIEISNDTYNNFIEKSPKVAFNLYEVQPLVWYLTSPGELSVDESNLINVLEFEEKVNWKNFSKYLKVNKEEESFLFTKGGEFLLPNRTNYIGYYHTMPDGKIMTGKEHGDGPELILIPLKSNFIIPSSEEISPTIQPPPSITTSSPSSGGGGGY